MKARDQKKQAVKYLKFPLAGVRNRWRRDRLGWRFAG